jgi:hypothetical protein
MSDEIKINLPPNLDKSTAAKIKEALEYNRIKKINLLSLLISIILFASCADKSIIKTYKADDVKVEIHVDSAAYYKGKSINLFIKIINNSNKPISHSEISLNLFNAETNKKLRSYASNKGQYWDEIGPYQERYMTLPLAAYYDFTELELIEGKYNFYINIWVKEIGEILSNTISFEVLPLRPEDEIYFNEIFARTHIEEFKSKADLFNNSFWDYEYHERLMRQLRFYEPDKDYFINHAIYDFMRKYPDAGYSYFLLLDLIRLTPEEARDSMKAIGGWSSKTFDYMYEQYKKRSSK